MTNHDDFNPEDKRPYWYCFSCGKALGKQGDGGDFQIAMGSIPPEAVINFGYGSMLDEGSFGDDLNPHLPDWKDAPHITGWICDECVVQKHDRLLVRERNRNPESHYDTFRYTKLAEHASTQYTIEKCGYYGTKAKEKGTDQERAGIQDHADITSEERAGLETVLLEKTERVHVDRLVLARLLDALVGAEIRIAKHSLAEMEADHKLYRRVRQQAQLLTAKEISEMRATENCVSDSRTEMLENVSWYEEKYEEMSRAWGECLRDHVHIHDEVNDGKPSVKGTDVTVASVFRLMRLRAPEDVAVQLNIPLESVRALVEACGNFFDQGFLGIMVTYAEHGYMDRWIADVASLAASKKRDPADVIPLKPEG